MIKSEKVAREGIPSLVPVSKHRLSFPLGTLKYEMLRRSLRQVPPRAGPRSRRHLGCGRWAQGRGAVLNPLPNSSTRKKPDCGARTRAFRQAPPDSGQHRTALQGSPVADDA